LVSRCVEALNSTGESDEMLDGCVDDVINLATDDFQIVGECMQCRFESHDALYRIVDLYIQVLSLFTFNWLSNAFSFVFYLVKGQN
jgi:hypothetical protein